MGDHSCPLGVFWGFPQNVNVGSSNHYDPMAHASRGGELSSVLDPTHQSSIFKAAVPPWNRLAGLEGVCHEGSVGAPVLPVVRRGLSF